MRWRTFQRQQRTPAVPPKERHGAGRQLQIDKTTSNSTNQLTVSPWLATLANQLTS